MFKGHVVLRQQDPRATYSSWGRTSRVVGPVDDVDGDVDDNDGDGDNAIDGERGDVDDIEDLSLMIMIFMSVIH